FRVFLGPKLARLAHSATLILLALQSLFQNGSPCLAAGAPSFRPSRPALQADETARRIALRPFSAHGARSRGRYPAPPPAPAGGGAEGLATGRNRPPGAPGRLEAMRGIRARRRRGRGRARSDGLGQWMHRRGTR